MFKPGDKVSWNDALSQGTGIVCSVSDQWIMVLVKEDNHLLPSIGFELPFGEEELVLIDKPKCKRNV